MFPYSLNNLEVYLALGRTWNILQNGEKKSRGHLHQSYHKILTDLLVFPLFKILRYIMSYVEATSVRKQSL